MKFSVDRSKLFPRDLSLLKILQTEYTDRIAQDVLVPLITQESPVSLRVLDWCVTNWSKQHNVVCTSQVPGQYTNIHHSYRNMLATWKRRCFDPFRRRNRITIEVGGKEYETTLGQANFALWAYNTGTLAYVINHAAEIEEDQNCVSKVQRAQRKRAEQSGLVRRRTELTAAPRSLCVAYLMPCEVSFEG